MPTYFYTAISSKGERTSGTEIAKNEHELARILRDKGYLTTSAVLHEKKRGGFHLFGFFEKFRGVALSERLLFVRNLNVMAASGVPLSRALDVLALQTKSKRFGDIVTNVRERVVQGQTMSQAMGVHPEAFSELFINMIKAGEESGTLEEVLSHLTLQLEREYDLRSKIKGALMYPAVIVTAMIGVGVLMLTLVVPKLAETFEELGVDLPLTTRLVIATGTFLAERWYLAFPLFFLLVFLFWRAIKTPMGKQIIDTWSLKVPVISGIIQKTNTALMTRTLSSLISSGVPIVRALEITSQVVGNLHFRESLSVSSEKVRKGTKLSASLKEYEHLYPLMVTQMIEVGEETGETGSMLAKIAEFFESEVTNTAKSLTSILEPILMLLVGIVVGFFAISMIQPMYSLISGFQ